MPQPASAVDVISPAIARARRLMFPYRWSRWWRLGLLALATGEMNSCGSGFSVPNLPSGGGSSGGRAPFPTFPIEAWIPFFIILGIGILVLVLVHTYVASVLRFALFDTVALERFHLRESWSRRHTQGLRFFGFNLLYVLVFWSVLALFGLMLWVMFRQSFASHAWGAGTVLLGVVLIFVVLFLAMLAGLGYVVIKDFTIPMVAIEDLSMTNALARLWRMVGARPGAYAGYLGMKILLSLAAGVLLGIVNFFLILIVVVPVVIVAIAIGVTAPHILQSPALIALAVTVGLFLVCLLLLAMAIVSSPVVAFFQSYALEFFAGRYQPLWLLLHPETPPAAPVPTMAPLPEPPPLPSPA